MLRQLRAALVEAGLATEADVPSAQDFQNAVLTRRFRLQLRDPLAVSAHALPSWCWEVARRYPWLITSSERMTLFRLTSFGVLKPVREFQEAYNAWAKGHPRAEEISVAQPLVRPCVALTCQTMCVSCRLTCMLRSRKWRRSCHAPTSSSQP